MKKFIIPVIVVFLCACLAGAYSLYKKAVTEKANDEIIPITEFYNLSKEDEVAIILDDELNETKGISRGGKIFLPMDFVAANIDDTFYYDEKNAAILYTLPEEIVHFESSAFIEDNGKIYLDLNVAKAYSSISCEVFTEGANRLFLDTRHESYETAELTMDDAIRTGDSLKQRIVTPVAAGERVRILEEKEEWSRVRTGSGFQGYVQNEVLMSYRQNQDISDGKQIEYTSIHYDFPILLAWHQSTSQSANNALQTVLETTKGINVISPTWFALNNEEGDFDSLASHDYVEYCHSQGIMVWALIDNFTNDVRTTQILKDSSKRAHLISGIMDVLSEYDIDGINIDFEQLETECGPHFAQFIRELSVSCRKAGKVLSVDNYNPANYNAFYRREVQAKFADYIINMGYDEHYAGGDAGSVSSYTWFADGIEKNLRTIPAEKLIGGIPFYTRIWEKSDGKTTSKAVGLNEAKKWCTDNKVDLEWISEFGQYYGEHSDSEGYYQIWLEDNESLKLKTDVIKNAGLAGIACWKLGLDSNEIWDVIRY